MSHKIVKYLLTAAVAAGALFGIGHLWAEWNESHGYVDRQPYLQKATTSGVVAKWQTPEAETGCIVYAIAGSDTHKRCEEAATQYHRIELTGLRKATTYDYSVLSASLKIDNRGRRFSTLDDNDSMNQTIWVLGDSGHRNGSQQAVKKAMLKHLHGRKIDTWIMLGDNAYRNGTQEQFNKGMFNAYPEMFKTNVLWSVIGNHDAHRSAYYDIMETPMNGESGGTASGSETYYAFEQGNVHFVMLDSQKVSRSADGEMARWLEQDLKANKKLWTVAVFHRPPYTKGTHDSDSDTDSGGSMTEMRENIVPILEKYDVDLVLSGHSHGYERSDLIHGHYGYGNTFDPSKHIMQSKTNNYTKCETKQPQGGTLYIVAGASSAGQYGINPFGRLHPAMKLGYFTDGSLLLTVEGARLRGEYVTNEGIALDRFTIEKRIECLR